MKFGALVPRWSPDLDVEAARPQSRRRRQGRGLIGRPQIVVAGEGEGERFWTGLKAIGSVVAPRGALVPHAHIVALMHEHGVTQVWTSDRDFRKFDRISVLDPFDDRYSAGFG